MWRGGTGLGGRGSREGKSGWGNLGSLTSEAGGAREEWRGRGKEAEY